MLPFLTTELGGTGGIIKVRAEDFHVEELPLYEAAGTGTHLFMLVEKQDVSTMDVIAQIARGLGIAKKDVGYAGLKDAHAISRQWFSVEHVKEAALQELQIPNVRIIEIKRHTNKLKTGHLAGNRFKLKLRKLATEPGAAEAVAKNILAVLEKRGVPNYFGPQRFGNRNDSHVLGKLIATGKIDEFTDLFLGKPQKDESPDFVASRRAYDRGDYKKAHDLLSYSFGDQRRALKALIETGGNKRKAYHVVDKRLKKFFISAFQADVFNRVLAARMPGIDSLLTGDIAYKHINGAMFPVEDAISEQARCESFEISPTGPLIGATMRQLSGPAGEIENPIIEALELNARDMEQIDNFAHGGRRPLRFQPRHWSVQRGKDEHSTFLEITFALDAGCYATTVLREITKTDIS